MPAFLSDEWLRDLDRVARTLSPPAWPEGETLVIEQVVSPGPGAADGGGARDIRADAGEWRWSLVVSGAGVRVERGEASAPDVTIFTDVATARSLAEGGSNAQGALAAGRLRVRGDLTRLAALHGALLALGDVFAAARAASRAPDA